MIVGRLGTGGMGLVYKAWQEDLKRYVAIKCITADTAASPVRRARFQFEAEAIARLKHPHIVHVYQTGVQKGVPYFIMELMEGGSLKEFLASTPQQASQSAALVETLARTVHYAHERGILHRDLKPANVLLTAEGSPKISDFGLALPLESLQGQPSFGEVVGTPSYMAPEQARGRLKDVGPQADVYALGAILYEMLTGRPPFKAASSTDTLLLVLEQEPVSPRQIEPRVPRDLETITLTCLQKEPAKRYASAAELAQDLQLYQTGKPIRARPVGPAERVLRWCRRKPTVAALLATVGVLLVLLVASACVSMVWLLAERGRVIAANQEANDARLDATYRLFQSYLDQARANRWNVQPGRRARALQALARASSIAEELQLPPESFLELRNEAIACLDMTDLTLAKSWKGYPAGSAGITFDAAFQRYARSDSKGNISVRQVADDTEIVQLTGLGKEAWLLRFSPDGQYLAANAPNHHSKVWDIARGRSILEGGAFPSVGTSTAGLLATPIGLGPLHAASALVPGRTDVPAGQLSFSPDSQRIAIPRPDNSISLFDVHTGMEQKRLKRAAAWPWALAFSPDGARLAICCLSTPTGVEVRDVAQDAVVMTLPHPDGVADAAWHPYRRILATACHDKRIYLWNVEGGSPQNLGALEGHESAVTVVAFNRAGTLLVSTGWDGSMRLWDPFAKKQLLSTPTGCGQGFPEYHFSPDDRWLSFFWDRGETVGIWEVASGPECRTLHSSRPEGNRAWHVAFSHQGDWLASAHGDGIRLWDRASSRELAHLSHVGLSQTVCFAPDPPALLAHADRGLHRWPIRINGEGETGSVELGPSHQLLAVAPATPAARTACLTPDGKWIAVSDRAKSQVVLVEMNGGKKVVLPGHSSIAWVTLSADAHWVAAGTWGGLGNVRVSDTRSGKIVWELKDGSCLGGFSPDGRWLATGGVECRLWEVGSWQLAKIIPNPASLIGVKAAVFSPDGKVLAIGYSSRVVRLVVPSSGQELATLANADGLDPYSMAFSADGSELAVGSNTGGIQVWDLRLLREELAKLALDWDQPPYPAPSRPLTTPMPRISVIEDAF